MQQDHNQHFSKYLVRVKEVILLFSLLIIAVLIRNMIGVFLLSP